LSIPKSVDPSFQKVSEYSDSKKKEDSSVVLSKRDDIEDGDEIEVARRDVFCGVVAKDDEDE